MLFSILFGLTLFTVAITVMPVFHIFKWWVRCWDFPRLQIFFLAALLIFLQLLFTDVTQFWPFLGILMTVSCALYQLWWIWPYTPFHATEVDSYDPKTMSGAKTLSILSSNVLQPNDNFSQLLERVNTWDPDVLVTLESDKRWENALKELESRYPHTMKCPLDNLYGMNLYSKYPLDNGTVDYLVEKDVPSMHACLRLDDECGIECHFLHPAPPSPTENESSQERDIELLVVAKKIKEKNETPIIVAGDLNDVAWSRTTRLFRKISGLLDPRIGRGMYNSFHAKYAITRWPLDHFFHSGHFVVKQLRRLPSIGSDHFPVLMELALRGQGEAKKNDLPVDGDDKDFTEEVLEDSDVTKHDVPDPNRG